MKVKELRVILDILDQLGHTDVNIVKDNGRDGVVDFRDAKIKVNKSDNKVKLVVS